MIEEILESFKTTLANFNILQAPRGVKVLETVIIEFNKRFGDGINVTAAGLHQSKFNFGDCFYYHSWRNNVVIAFGTLSSFLI